MLSGVASDSEVMSLTRQLTSAQLVRIMNRIQTTLSGFTRSASRRMDAELCILELCQPELSLDAKALNARLTRLEEQLKSGKFVVSAPKAETAKPEDVLDDDRPPLPDDDDAPPALDEPMIPSREEIPMGFWPELCGSVRKELKPPVFGFFAATPNAPIRGSLKGNRLELLCNNTFVAEAINKPEILEVVSRKASAMLGRPITAFSVDMTKKAADNSRLEQLMNFGREHSDIIKIKNH